MIWMLIYLVVLFMLVSSALLAGMRKGQADFFAEKDRFSENLDEMERIKASI